MDQDASKYTDAQHCANLSILVARLVQQVRKHDVNNDVANKAMDYIKRANLDGSILRGVTENIRK
jgi:hypothetical protein